MPSDSGSTISSAARELGTAQSLLRAGRLAEAEQAFHQVLAADPQQVPALRFLAGAAMRRGTPGAAIDLLNRAAQVDRDDIGTLTELGVAYRVADRLDASRSVLERALELTGGRDTSIRLLLANVLELDQRPELALLHYFRAILDAQHGGHWLDDGGTPPGLRPLVSHAMRHVADGRRALFDTALQAWRAQHAADVPGRIARALAIYLRDRRESPADPRQRPTLLYVPDLGTSPLLVVPHAAWLAPLLAGVAMADAELGWCLHSAAPAPAAAWRADLYRRGMLPDAVRQHAPRLLDALAATPLMRIPRHAPDAAIIGLPAATHTAVGYGLSNAGCTAVVGLPGSAAVDVTAGADTHRLQAGEAIVVDASYGVGYANPGAADARILVFDVWHPGLDAAEQEALAAVFTTIVDFDTRLQELA